jgi:hypothetical protein
MESSGLDAISILSQISTMTLAIVAVFGRPIGSFIRKPIFRIDFEPNKPYIDRLSIGENESASDIESYIVCRVKLSNYGYGVSRNTNVYIDRIDTRLESNGGTQKGETFLPASLKIINKGNTVHLSPKESVFIELLRMSKSKLSTTPSDKSKESDTKYLWLISSDGKKLELQHKITKGTHYIPIKIKCGNSRKIITQNFELYWNGGHDISTKKGNFHLKKIKKIPN